MTEKQNVIEKIKSVGETKENIESEDNIEKQIERGREKVLDIIKEKRETVNDSISQTSVAQAIGGQATEQKQQTKKIECVLEDRLDEIYLKMPESMKHKFKYEGEKTAAKINQLLNKTKINIKKIVNLIRKWLLIIPGVNVFFLEQEAKIKADEIVKIKLEN